MDNVYVSSRSRLIDVLLCYFLGVLGIHKFYEGKIGMGILYIFTGGLFTIGVLVDLIMILVGSATDADGNAIKIWMPDEAEQAAYKNGTYGSTSGVDTSKKEEENIEILRQYKDMLDEGIITQEEYDKKKKDILR